ncbi:hypothetical protein ABZ860_15735 [Microbispora sp. NPDC046973]|uniref:hypothetical protein n=1 Tax=Microbispora sp. NPDC046973 TaxID=3155022 RepID=UPI0033DFD2C6
MSMPHRNRMWIWVGRLIFGLIVIGLVAYISAAGLDKADKLASVLGFLVALAALVVPHLFPLSSGGGGRGSTSSAANATHGRIDARHAKRQLVASPTQEAPGCSSSRWHWTRNE